jgi:hypothetical protein
METGMLRTTGIQIETFVHSNEGLAWEAIVTAYPELTQRLVDSMRAYLCWRLLCEVYEDQAATPSTLVKRLENVSLILEVLVARP